jgi:hypothetical protein
MEEKTVTVPFNSPEADKAALLKELDDWNLNSITFVWGHFGFPEKSLWLIYGTYNMRMPEINFVLQPKSQFVLRGKGETYDIHQVPVSDLVEKWQDHALCVCLL